MSAAPPAGPHRAVESDLLPRPPVALYVHIPFCLSLCPYCDFVVYPGAAARGPRSRTAAFLVALHNEIVLRAERTRALHGASSPTLRSVYLGGGTPSLLAAADVERLLSTIAGAFGISPDAEITMEANPGPADRGDLVGFRAAGVNRLSIGAQSLDGTDLKRLGRRHSASDVLETIGIARDAGFRSLSVDLLYDIPGQSRASWAATVDKVAASGVDHVSAYALTLSDAPGEGSGLVADHLPRSNGARRWRERAVTEQDEDRAADMYELADRLLSASRFRWYELSNWSRRGHESRHNLAYWTGEPYEAVGPGAHAYDGALTRSWNAAMLDPYVTALSSSVGRAPRLPPGGQLHLTADTATADRVILALRLRRGIARDDGVAKRYAASLSWARTAGLVEEAAGALRFTLRGRLLSNLLFSEIA